jgi:hypothetical protein
MGLGDLVNLYRIQKLYKHIRKAIENPSVMADIKYWTELFKIAISIREVKEMLNGYKTYIVAALTAAVTLLHSLGYIDDATYKALLALLGAGAMGTVAAKINRIQSDIDSKLTKGK